MRSARAVVDVICFRYWWQTDKGLFAPKGGQNLSPRQFERQWKGGTPNRRKSGGDGGGIPAKFSGKAIIASGEDADLRGSWAFVCAGGSMPNLPRTTDAKSAGGDSPNATVAGSVGGTNRWVLREPGKQYLVYTPAEKRPAELDLSAETGSFQAPHGGPADRDGDNAGRNGVGREKRCSAEGHRLADEEMNL